MAILLFYNKEITKEGDVVEWNLWKVDKSKHFPYGIKYRLAYIHKNKRILGYDNERKKGDHRHYFGREVRYEFVNPDKLRQDFEFDVKKIREFLYEKKEN